MQGKFADKLISTAAADRLIAAHDGDLALLHIFMQRTGSRDLERAAVELCRTMREMEAAYEKLMRMGLVEEGQSCSLEERSAAPRKLLPADELPEYTAEEVVAQSSGDAAFTAVLNELEQIYGKKLSTPDTRKLFAIYHDLDLPAEVLMELLHYCVYLSENRLPTIRFIEKQAVAWANREILTLEQAEEYIRLSKQRREDSGKVAEAMNIRGRELSRSEKDYICSWLDMGFDLDVILLAYDRTVTNTGGLKWGYMNKILSNWKEKGLCSVEEIEEKDSRRPSAVRPGQKQPIDKNRLRDELRKI